MAFAQIGPLTTLFEGFATAVGAGVVLGGFAMGIFRVLARRPREELEAKVLIDGYAGGVVGVVVVLLDSVIALWSTK
jgi:hypothetical protein